MAVRRWPSGGGRSAAGARSAASRAARRGREATQWSRQLTRDEERRVESGWPRGLRPASDALIKRVGHWLRHALCRVDLRSPAMWSSVGSTPPPCSNVVSPETVSSSTILSGAFLFFMPDAADNARQTAGVFFSVASVLRSSRTITSFPSFL